MERQTTYQSILGIHTVAIQNINTALYLELINNEQAREAIEEEAVNVQKQLDELFNSYEKKGMNNLVDKIMDEAIELSERYSGEQSGMIGLADMSCIIKRHLSPLSEKLQEMKLNWGKVRKQDVGFRKPDDRAIVCKFVQDLQSLEELLSPGKN